ncbi:MAG: squalene--hopene cyclase, partial [Acidimicrobiales bacterium]
MLTRPDATLAEAEVQDPTAGPDATLAPADATERAAAALTRGRDHLLGLQDEAGWWKGELETNVTMDAEDLLLRELLGIRTDAGTAATAAWIRSQQRED